MKKRKAFFIVALALVAFAVDYFTGAGGGIAVFSMAGVAVLGADGAGKHLSGANEGLSVSAAKEYSPDMIDHEADREVVMQFNSGVPIGTFLRYLPHKKINSMEFGYYSVDLRQVAAKTLAAVTAVGETCQLDVGDLHSIFDINNQIYVDGVNGYDGAVQRTGLPYNLMVVGKTTDTVPKLICQPINGAPVSGKVGVTSCLAIPSGSGVYRITDLIDEPQNFNDDSTAIPQKTTQFCQIFMTTYSETELSKTESKEVDWGEQELKQLNTYQMQKEVEAALIYGVKSYTKQSLPKSRYVYTFDGFLSQALKGGSPIISLNEADLLGEAGEAKLIDMMRELFVGNSGSNKKYMFAGSNVIATLSKVKLSSKNSLALRREGSVEQFGVKFDKITSMFGDLYVYSHPSTEEYNDSWNAYIIDLSYADKRTREALRSDAINDPNYRGSKKRMLETWAPLFKYPKAHGILRIVNA